MIFCSEHYFFVEFLREVGLISFFHLVKIKTETTNTSCILFASKTILLIISLGKRKVFRAEYTLAD